MHKLLARQVGRALGSDALPADEAQWRDFLSRVDEAYHQADTDRTQLERSLDLASEEMLDRTRKLRADHALLSTTLESAGDAIAVTTMDGSLVAYNHKYVELWGFSSEHLQPAAVADRLAWAAALCTDPNSVTSDARRILADPVAVVSDMIAFVDGRRIARDTRPHMMAEKPIGRVWWFRDVTSSHKAAEELRRAETRFRSLVENISDVITITDEAGRYQYVSPSVERALGYEPREFVGKRIFDFHHPNDVDKVAASMAFLAATGGAVQTEFRCRHKDGTYRVLESRRIDARDVPGIGGFLGVARDVTKDRRIEAEAKAHQEAAWRHERLSALGTLVAGVAHEINNPLTYIVGNLELAQLLVDELPETPERAELREQLDVALSGSQRIARITTALRVVARHDEAASRNAIALDALAREVVELVRRTTPPHVTVALESADPEARVLGDRTQLHQVVLNLTKNAVEALGEAMGRVQLAVRRIDNLVEVSICDDGPGMEAELQTRLFTPFFTTKAEGTGLGLSIVQGIVKAHGGEVLFESAPARGATFRVRLPLHVVTVPADVQMRAEDEPSTAPSGAVASRPTST